MNILGAVACLLVAWDCLGKALGTHPQSLFSADALWLWYVIAALWAWNGIKFILIEFSE